MIKKLFSIFLLSILFLSGMKTVELAHSSSQTTVLITVSGEIVNATNPLKGLNYGWNDGNGANIHDWISTKWNETKVRMDFDEMQKMGVTLTRTYIAPTSYTNWDWAWTKGYRGFNEYIVNVDKLLQIAKEHGMRVIFNILWADGAFHWDALNRPAQRLSYLNMMSDLTLRYKNETAIYSFNLFNEPYTMIEINMAGAEGSPLVSGITPEILHSFLKDCYNTIKANDPNRLVSFEESSSWGLDTLTSNFDKYFELIDDCVDYYQFDVYRDASDIIANGLENYIYRKNELTKPIVFGEIGAHGNNFLDAHYQ